MILRFDELDTTPGAVGETALFAPPADVITEAAYRKWLWDQSADVGMRQMYACANRGYQPNTAFAKPKYVGPFKHVLEKAIREFQSWSSIPHKPKKPVVQEQVPSSAPLDLFVHEEIY